MNHHTHLGLHLPTSAQIAAAYSRFSFRLGESAGAYYFFFGLVAALVLLTVLFFSVRRRYVTATALLIAEAFYRDLPAYLLADSYAAGQMVRQVRADELERETEAQAIREMKKEQCEHTLAYYYAAGAIDRKTYTKAFRSCAIALYELDLNDLDGDPSGPVPDAPFYLPDDASPGAPPRRYQPLPAPGLPYPHGGESLDEDFTPSEDDWSPELPVPPQYPGDAPGGGTMAPEGMRGRSEGDYILTPIGPMDPYLRYFPPSRYGIRLPGNPCAT